MAFPTTPTNGQQATVGNVTYQYAAATNSWARIPGIANTISATGNITASYFIGNGSALTGIDATRIQNGTSNVAVLVNSNVTVGVTGTSNVAVFTPTGLEVASTISATGNISAVGNVSGTYFLGNGSLLSGIITSVSNINNGTSNVTVLGSGSNITVGVAGTSNVVVFATTGEYVTGEISASGNITGANLNAAGLSLSSNVISNFNVTANIAGGNITTPGLMSATGNITGGNLITSAAVSAASVSAAGNVTGGNVNTNTIVGTDTTVKSTGALNLSATGNITINNTYINGVTDPAQPQDVATKNYVDSIAQGLHVHDSANLASTQDLATYTGATVTYSNGASGVGATLSLVGNTLTTLDGTAIPASAGTRLLIKNQANAVLNGMYNYTSSSLLTRTTDFDTTAEAAGGDFLFVTSGATQADTGWVQTTDNPTLGTSPIVFTQFSGAGTYTANTSAGLVLNGSVFSAKTDNITTAFDGTGNIIVKASAALTTPNIGAATGTSLSVTGNITGGNLNAAGLSLSGNVVSALNVSGNVAGANITTPGLISATGNITGGNVLGGANVNATTHTGTTVSVTGNVNGGNLISAALAQAVTLSASGNVIGGNITTAGLISATGNITGGNVLGGANVNATTHTGTTVSVTGNVTGAGHIGTIYTNSIVNTGANLTGNIGSTTGYFNTAFVKATSAQYADLAEMYVADAAYSTGTVLIFGGKQEVTADLVNHSTAIAGVVSKNPSYLMNSGLQGEHVAIVALLGRVPCQVQGVIRKGDLLVASNTAGVAQRLDPAQYQPGCVIGKALANYDSEVTGMIEIAVGVK